MKTIKQEPNLLVLSAKLINQYILGAVLLFFGLIIALTLKTSHENFGIVLFIVILQIVGGILLILFGGKKEITFDKVSGEIIVDYLRHIHKKQKKYPLSDASYIKKELRRSGNARSSSITYSYFLYLNTGKKLLISTISKGMISSLSSAFKPGQSSHPISVVNVANFLNLEVRENKISDTIASAANAASRFFKKN